MNKEDIIKEIKKFGKLCYKTQEEMKAYLCGFLASNHYKVISEDGFIYAKGDLPYLVTAHMDTVHKKQCSMYTIHNYKGMHRVQSSDGIGGDDRCGIYIIKQLVLDGYRPSILFCEDEEIGGIGSDKFTKTEYIEDLEDLNFLIELDRRNANDAVFYDCDNPDFTKYIIKTTGYEENWGTFSDICNLSEVCRIASVNLSCGYYNEHTLKEYVIFEEMLNTIKVVEKLLRAKNCEQYIYIPAKYTYTGNNKYYFDDVWYKDYYGAVNFNTDEMKEISGMQITYNDRERHCEDYAWAGGESIYECFFNFFIENPTVCYNDVIDYYLY